MSFSSHTEDTTALAFGFFSSTTRDVAGMSPSLSFSSRARISGSAIGVCSLPRTDLDLLVAAFPDNSRSGIEGIFSSANLADAVNSRMYTEYSPSLCSREVSSSSPDTKHGKKPLPQSDEEYDGLGPSRAALPLRLGVSSCSGVLSAWPIDKTGLRSHVPKRSLGERDRALDKFPFVACGVPLPLLPSFDCLLQTRPLVENLRSP
mmetsp:Transcript_659/g.907  ORF Transcript_659/g.907 Transcript_659/m.907 type:complete len:205 (+) Transcript_659:181-795(+)